MSSPSTTDPLSRIPSELKDLLSWNPPKLNPLPIPGEKMSISTRALVFFDRHFSEKLKLLRVKRLPSLAHDIATIVDETIMGYFDDNIQLPPPDRLQSVEQRKYIVRTVDWDMADEKAVANFYERTTATFCAPVASTLALRLSNWDALLMWTQSANVSGYAIADGFLKVAGPTRLTEMEAELSQAVDEETLRLLRSLSKRRVSLVTSEFKNMAAGGPEVMLAIPGLSNLPIFDWTDCKAPNCAEMTNHQKELKKVEEVVVGPDAKKTPWALDSHSSNLMSPTFPEPREIGEIPPASASVLLPPFVLPPTLSTGSSSVQGSSEDVGTSKAVKRKRDDDSSSKSRADSPPAPEAPELRKSRRIADINARTAKKQIAAKKRKPGLMLPPPPPVGSVRTETASPRGKGKGKAVQGEDDASAKFVVQRAWAQATRVDGSIIVLQSGNDELIGIRHRATQTLYISDLINPHACREPSYGKLHVGIYLAGLNDALDRERQVRSAQPPGGGNGPFGGGGNGPSRSGGNNPSGGGSSGPSGSDGNGPSGGGGDKREGPSGSDPGSGHRNRMSIATHEMAAKSTLELASGRNVMLLYLQYGIYDSPAPSTFVRSGPIGQPTLLPSQETIQNYQLEECLTIVLRSEIGHGATGQVLRGTLEVEASECALLDVAVKLALTSEQREALRDEYEIYRRLSSKGVTTGITTPLGLFDDVEGGACTLVMPYVGAPLAAMPELVLPISYWEAVLATLTEIHCADILHGDLSLDNILVADSGLTIIDFSHSQVCVDQDAKNSEFLQLQSLLDRREK